MWIHITRPFIYKVSGCLFIVIITVFLETVLHIITFFFPETLALTRDLVLGTKWEAVRSRESLSPAGRGGGPASRFSACVEENILFRITS